MPVRRTPVLRRITRHRARSLIAARVDRRASRNLDRSLGRRGTVIRSIVGLDRRVVDTAQCRGMRLGRCGLQFPVRRIRDRAMGGLPIRVLARRMRRPAIWARG